LQTKLCEIVVIYVSGFCEAERAINGTVKTPLRCLGSSKLSFCADEVRTAS